MDNGIYSQRLRAGRRRTYFFDVRTTKNDDYYITITESKKRFDGDGYERHKLFLYKEDFNKFLVALENTVNHVKTDLLPDYNFEEFDREPEDYTENGSYDSSTVHQEAKQATENSQEKNLANEQTELKKEIAQAEEELSSIVEDDLSF